MNSQHTAPTGLPAEYDSRIHLRLPVSLAEQLRDRYETQSQGVRAAMEYAIVESPLPAWPVDRAGGDLDDTEVKRVSVRASPTVDEALEDVLATEEAPGKSRAVRDAARGLLKSQTRTKQ